MKDMDNLLESKGVVKITNLDSEATEDSMKQLITLLVHLKGTIQDIAIVNLVNGEHNYNYAYMFFQYDCDAKETAATLNGLFYRSFILDATVLDENECSEAFSLLTKIQNTKKAEQLNLDAYNIKMSSSCSSTASKEHSHEQICLSDAQRKDSASSSSSISNDKLSSDENDNVQNVTGKTPSSIVYDKGDNNESQSGSDDESDTESDEDDSESSTESETAEKPEQVSRRHYCARNDKFPGDRGHGWRGRGRGRGGRVPRLGSTYNNNRDRRHIPNNNHWANERSNRGHQQYHPSNTQVSRNLNRAPHFFKGSDLKQSNIQNQNYQRPQTWNTSANLPFVPNCGPFNTNNQSYYPSNTQPFPNYSIPPPNFTPPVYQHNQQQHNEPNTHHSPQNPNDNGSDKNINVSISWTQQRGSQNINDSKRPNQVTGNVRNTSHNQQLLESGNNSQRRNYQSHNKKSDNSYNEPPCSSVNHENLAHNNQGSSNLVPLKQEAVTTPANQGPAITTSISTSSQSTVGRFAPPVPSRIKAQPTTPTTSASTSRASTNIGGASTALSHYTSDRTKPAVPSRINVSPTTPTAVACSSSTRSTAAVPRALPNIEGANEAVVSLNIGATRLSTRPSIAEKKKSDKPCVIS